MDFSSTATTYLYFLSLCMYLCVGACSELTYKVVDLENPVLQFSPSFSINGDKEIVQCGRVRIGGVSRLNIQSYASSFRVTLTPSGLKPKRLQLCFHRNASLGLCQCGNDNWKTIQNGQWNALMSPYQDRYVDVMFMDGVSSAGSVKVSVEEQVHRWRLVCLAFGFVLLMLAPFLSEWVPFYYSSFMAVGVLLVVLVLVFQTMKLLPTSRKKALYVGISLMVMGVGSFVTNYFQMLVNSVLGRFGLREDMYYLVSICLLLGIVLVGATMAYWIMCKFVISDDGRVGVRVVQFVKWAMRTVAVTFILQSTLDVPFAMVALTFCWGIYFYIMSPRWRSAKTRNKLATKKVSPNHSCAKFLSRAPPKRLWNTLRQSFAWAVWKYPQTVSEGFEERFYSSFHKTPSRKRFSDREWEDFTNESTRKAVAELASSPEFSDWIVENAERIKMDPEYSSDD